MATKNEIEESRSEERVPVALPVKTSFGNCITRDISATAVLIESSAKFNIGDQVKFEIEFDSPSGKLLFKCNGDVMRVEARDGRYGAAVKIVDSVMESTEGSIYTDSINFISSACKSAGHSG